MDSQARQSAHTPIEFLALVVLAIISAGAFIYFTIELLPFIADDAYITFRYSQNLASGYGPTFNAGRPPVEGYTTFTWMLLMAIPHLIGIGVVPFAKIAGILLTIGTMIVAYIFAQNSCGFLSPADRTWPGMVAVFLVAIFYPSAVHAVSGMETPWFMFLLTLLFLLSAMLVEKPDHRRAFWFSLVCLLTGLTRPEGNIVVWFMAPTIFFLIPKEKRIGFVKAFALFYLLPGIVYYIWRFAYYSLPLPLPAYVKMVFGEEGNPLAPHGLPLVLRFLGTVLLFFGIPMLIGILGLGRKHIPAIVGTVVLLVFFVFPYHTMSFTFRFLYPVAPMLFVVAGIGIGLLVGWMKSWIVGSEAKVGFLISIVVLGICVMMGASTISSALVSVRDKVEYGIALSRVHIRIGRHLAEFDPQGEEMVLAVPDAGAIPYITRWTTIDTGGLNDRAIALEKMTVSDRVISSDPDLVIINSNTASPFTPKVAFEGPLYNGCMENGLEPVLAIEFAQDYYLYLMCNPESRLAAHIKRLEQSMQSE